MEDNKSLEDIKELVDALNIITDYTLSMKMVTKYNPSGSPNLLNIQRIVNRIKKEYKI